MSHSKFQSFKEFYPFYLGEHSNSICRRLHFFGTSGVLLIALLVIFQQLRIHWLWALPVCGYGFAWVGHFFFEKNRPATFKHPLYSFIGDWVMYKDILIGKIRF
jgi:hypothetical protein